MILSRLRAVSLQDSDPDNQDIWSGQSQGGQQGLEGAGELNVKLGSLIMTVTQLRLARQQKYLSTMTVMRGVE